MELAAFTKEQLNAKKIYQVERAKQLCLTAFTLILTN